MSFDIAILGSGAAGIALADLAARTGFRVVVLDCAPMDGFASLHNQSWLHSGALYAVGNKSGTSSTVELCKRGREWFYRLKSELRDETLISTEPALMLFGTESKLLEAHDGLRSGGLTAEFIKHRKLSILEPLLGSAPPFAGGILTADVTVDTARILNLLMRRAAANGCLFLKLPIVNFAGLFFENATSGWMIRSNYGLQINAKNVILASGVLNPFLVERILAKPFRGALWKCAVLALNCAATKRIIIMNDERTNLMNIAPFPYGITVNLGKLDDLAERADDYDLSEDYIKETLNVLCDYTPGLSDYLPVRGRIYACQKWDPPGHGLPGSGVGKRDYFCSELERGLHVIYPGKFTECFILAEAMISKLEGRAGSEAREPAIADLSSENWQYVHPGTLPPELAFEWQGDSILVKKNDIAS